jgi:hypothetical protein
MMCIIAAMIGSGERSWRSKAASLEGAALAGLLHAGLLAASLALMQYDRPPLSAGDDEITAFLSNPDATARLVVAMNLTPISVIAFLWFIAVVRRRIGDREDRFFSTVFLGSGLVLAALLLVGSAIQSATAVLFTQTGRVLDPEAYRLLRSVGQGVLSVAAPRLGAVFILTTSNLGRRTGVLPRWLVVFGSLAGLAMIVDVTFSPPMPYLFPGWVALVSLTMLVRRQNGTSDVGSPHSDGT